jgi:hypothetical protein
LVSVIVPCFFPLLLFGSEFSLLGVKGFVFPLEMDTEFTLELWTSDFFFPFFQVLLEPKIQAVYPTSMGPLFLYFACFSHHIVFPLGKGAFFAEWFFSDSHDLSDRDLA